MRGATSPDSAIPIRDIPEWIRKHIKRLVACGIVSLMDGRVYVNLDALRPSSLRAIIRTYRRTVILRYLVAVFLSSSLTALIAYVGLRMPLVYTLAVWLILIVILSAASLVRIRQFF